MNIQPKVCGLSQFFDTYKSVLSYFKVCEVMGCGTSKEEMSATMDPPATSCHQKIVRLVIAQAIQAMCLKSVCSLIYLHKIAAINLIVIELWVFILK